MLSFLPEVWRPWSAVCGGLRVETALAEGRARTALTSHHNTYNTQVVNSLFSPADEGEVSMLDASVFQRWTPTTSLAVITISVLLLPDYIKYLV